MNTHLGVRILALLAVVAAATLILVHPGAGPDPALNALLSLGRS
jgi:hypothetical protein